MDRSELERLTDGPDAEDLADIFLERENSDEWVEDYVRGHLDKHGLDGMRDE